MVNSETLTAMMVNRDTPDDDGPHWSDGSCDKCGRDTLVLTTTAHREYDALCLPCSDSESEDGDLSMLVRGTDNE